MKKIYYAMVEPTLTDGEYQMQESTVCEYGEEWNGDVRGYVENLGIDADSIEGGAALGNIHQPSSWNPIPGSVCVLMNNNEPVEIYWAEEADE